MLPLAKDLYDLAAAICSERESEEAGGTVTDRQSHGGVREHARLASLED